MFRLLKKEDIQIAKNSDKTKEVAEGLKISRRVDGLRELAAKEEENLNKFRVESLSAVQKELQELQERKEQAEINLKKVEETLEQTLSKTEQHALDDLRKSLDRKAKEIKEKAFELDLKEIDIALTSKETSEALTRQKNFEESSKNLHLSAILEKAEADRIVKTARQIEELAIKTKEDTEKELVLREKGIETREKEVQKQTEDNLRVSRELEGERVQLADQRKTLERALERIRQNRL